MALLRLLSIFIALLSAGAVRPERLQQESFVQGGSNQQRDECRDFDSFMYFKTIKDICIAGCLVGVLTLIVSFAILCCGFMKKYAKHMAGLNLLVASVMFLLPYIASCIASKQVIDDACKGCNCDDPIPGTTSTPRQAMQVAATGLGIIAAYFQGGLIAFLIGWIEAWDDPQTGRRNALYKFPVTIPQTSK
eukprot:symbB.v1.2.031833.t1/scaffold3739.1/size51156/4